MAESGSTEEYESRVMTIKKTETPIPNKTHQRQSDKLLDGNSPFLYQRKFSISEAALLLKIGETKLRELVVGRIIPSIQIGGKYILLERDLDAFLKWAYSGTILTIIKNEEPEEKPRLSAEIINSKHLN